MIDMIATPFSIGDISLYKEAGASSVVIATPFFSARGAHLFELEELADIKQTCLANDMRMLVKVNRFFTEEELPSLQSYLLTLKNLDVDGIYYGDECVLFEAKKLGIVGKLIYAPDTLLTNQEDVNYYLQEGISMVSISKEITLEEICQIAASAPGRVEVGIHGRVNMMHSKRQLLSHYLEFIGKEEEVHGKHTLYIKEEHREEHMPILEDDLGTHVFSGYTLASFEELHKLVEAGVQHVSIDGIFHDQAYVMEALQLYTSILNGADATIIKETYEKRYAMDHVTNGFYETKTSKRKVGE